MPVTSAFTPLQWKNGINPKSQGSFQTFMKQLADWANNIQNQVAGVSNPGSFAGYAFYTGSASGLSSTPSNITNWSAGIHNGLAITLGATTTFTVPGISMVQVQAVTPADGLSYSVLLNSISGTGLGASSGGGRTGAQYLSFAGAQSAGSFTIQAAATGTGSVTCSLAIFVFNL